MIGGTGLTKPPPDPEPLTREDLKRLTDSGVIRDNYGIPSYDPNPDMHQYIVRGYGHDHGEMHRTFTYDGVVRGAFTFVSSEIVRADRELERLVDETPEERQVRGLLMNAYGIDDYKSTIMGGFGRLLWHATQSILYGFSLLEATFGSIYHVELPPPKPKPAPPDPLVRRVEEGNEPLGSKPVEDAEGDGDSPSDSPPSQPEKFASPPKPPAAASGGAGKPGAAQPLVQPPAMIDVKLPEAPPPPPRKKVLALLPVKCSWIAPWSVERWIWEDGEPIAIVQFTPEAKQTGAGAHLGAGKDRAIGGIKLPVPGSKDTVATELGILGSDRVVVPLRKCLLFQNQAVDGNPEGLSAFRSAYPWVCAKLDTLARDQMAADRLVDGLMVVKETGTEYGPHRSITAEDGAMMRKMLDALRDGLSNRVVVPFGFEFEDKWPGYDIPDHVELYKYYDHQILLSVMSTILGLDATGAASRGLSDGLSAIAYHMIEHLADQMAEVINGDGREYTGLSERIVRANMPDFEGRIPKLKFSNIRYQDMEKLIDLLSKAAQFLLYTPGPEDERRFRQIARLPVISEDEIAALRQASIARNGQSQQSGQSLQNQPLKPGAGASGKDSVGPAGAGKGGKTEKNMTEPKGASIKP